MTQEEQNYRKATAYCYHLDNELHAKYGTEPGLPAAWHKTDDEWIRASASLKAAKEAFSVAVRASEAAKRAARNRIADFIAFEDRCN